MKSDVMPQTMIEASPPNPESRNRISSEEFPEYIVYESMGLAITSCLNEFLQPFQSTLESTLVLKSMTREDFFPRFFRLANKLTDDCCQNLVAIIRSSSVLAAVRESPVPGLAKRIRDMAFKSQDEILANYFSCAKKIETIYKNINTIRDTLNPSAFAPAQPDTTQPGSTAAAEPAADKKWATDGELLRQHQALAQAQKQAFSKIAQYMNTLNDLPRSLLAYACDKCFAGEVNYSFEHEQEAACKEAIKLKLANALETFARVGVLAREDVEEERAGILANIEMQKTHQVLEKMWEAKLEAKSHADRRFKRIVAAAFAGLAIILVLLAVLFWIFIVKK